MSLTAGASAKPFRAILCALDATDASREAARQAVVLTRNGAELTWLTVVATGTTDLEEGGPLTPALALDAAEHATQTAADHGVAARTLRIEGTNPGRVLVSESAGFDLVVVGSQDQAPVASVAIGTTASAALHAASAPVLVARKPPAGGGFPGDVLIASDGSPDSARGLELGAGIARQHGTGVTVLHVDDGHGADAGALENQIAAATQAIGVAPAILEDAGDPRQRIVELARAKGASLLIMGSRGLGGVRTLGSVSERVAHEAPCSVLVSRPRLEK